MVRRTRAMEERWTWAEIEELRFPATPALRRKRAAFLRRYGDRAKAALVAAGHAEGTWAPCCFYTESPSELTSIGLCACPLDYHSKWVEKIDPEERGACSSMSMAVYRVMVTDLGLLQEKV